MWSISRHMLSDFSIGQGMLVTFNGLFTFVPLSFRHGTAFTMHFTCETSVSDTFTFWQMLFIQSNLKWNLFMVCIFVLSCNQTHDLGLCCCFFAGKILKHPLKQYKFILGTVFVVYSAWNIVGLDLIGSFSYNMFDWCYISFKWWRKWHLDERFKKTNFVL